MFKQKTFKNSILLSKLLPRHVHGWTYSRWTVVSVAVALLLCFAIYAQADLVYGRVYGAEGNFPPEGTFTLTNNEDENVYQVITDENRGYSIFLPPGIYSVEFIDGDDIRWEAEIRSVNDPIQQDIHLERAR